MNEPREYLPRDQKALRYLDALYAGDLEAVSTLWEEASHDPELERMLAELDDAMYQEIPGNPSTLAARLERRPRRWGVRGIAAGTTAAACLLAMLAWPWGETNNPGPNPPLGQTKNVAPSGSSADSRDLRSLVSARRNLDEAAIPGFVWPLESVLSASTPRDLID